MNEPSFLFVLQKCDGISHAICVTRYSSVLVVVTLFWEMACRMAFTHVFISPPKIGAPVHLHGRVLMLAWTSSQIFQGTPAWLVGVGLLSVFAFSVWGFAGGVLNGTAGGVVIPVGQPCRSWSSKTPSAGGPQELRRLADSSALFDFGLALW